jgi:Family of unknown function (DUF5709)
MSQGPYEADPGTPDPESPIFEPDDEAERDYQPEAMDTIDPGDPASAVENLYDTSWVPPDRPPQHGDFGTTLAEEREGESLDARLAEEEPDVFDPLPRDEAAAGATAATEMDGEDPEVEASLRADGGDTDFPAASFAEADPRAGRLVADDEGAHPDEEAALIARDVGISGAGASAEEAAVHVVDEDRI